MQAVSVYSPQSVSGVGQYIVQTREYMALSVVDFLELKLLLINGQ